MRLQGRTALVKGAGAGAATACRNTAAAGGREIPRACDVAKKADADRGATRDS